MQARFVDDPGGRSGCRGSARPAGDAANGAIRPTHDFERRAADVSVDYPDVVENYREGHGLWDRYSRADGAGDTENLRQAMVHFRLLFEELLEGERVEQGVR